mgnify:CR=1 FL=1
MLHEFFFTFKFLSPLENSIKNATYYLTKENRQSILVVVAAIVQMAYSKHSASQDPFLKHIKFRKLS